MNAFTFLAAVLVVAFVVIGVTYSRQRRRGTYDPEGTRKAVTRSPDSAADSGGIGGNGF